jgi:hypothetical protein
MWIDVRRSEMAMYKRCEMMERKVGGAAFWGEKCIQRCGERCSEEFLS